MLSIALSRILKVSGSCITNRRLQTATVLNSSRQWLMLFILYYIWQKCLNNVTRNEAWSKDFLLKSQMVRGLHLEIKYFFIIHVLKLLHLVLCFIARYVTAIVCLLLYAGNKLALSLNSLLFHTIHSKSVYRFTELLSLSISQLSILSLTSNSFPSLSRHHHAPCI